MIILVPMGGKGTRFSEAGYKENKACILTTDRHSGKKLPMVVCAMKDIPGISDQNNKIICVDRDFHAANGTEEEILKVYNRSIFVHDHVLLDQAFGCFLAREFLDSDEELFIGACDNGMDIDVEAFEIAKKDNDALMISHTNDQNISRNPHAHSWARLSDDGKNLSELSLKKTVSDDPMNDHATTGMFWFKNARVFLEYLEKMIWAQDTLKGKYYIDRLLQYYIADDKNVSYFDVRYICWGTPLDYEDYERTFSYWSEFYKNEQWLNKN